MLKSLATLTAVLIALTAQANPARCGLPEPDPANAECPGPCIKVVGHDGAVGDPIGQYCITLRDFNNVPVPNSTVIVDFSNCDIQLCADQKDPGVIVDCVSQTLRKFSDVNGVACFRVIGRRRNADCAPKPNPCVEAFWEGTFLCALYAPAFDLVNEPGVGLSGTDLSEFLHLFFDCGVYLSAIDYNCNDSIDGDDFSQFLTAFFAQGSVLGCDSKCP
jgi:hypothetical protein